MQVEGDQQTVSTYKEKDGLLFHKHYDFIDATIYVKVYLTLSSLYTSYSIAYHKVDKFHFGIHWGVLASRAMVFRDLQVVAPDQSNSPLNPLDLSGTVSEIEFVAFLDFLYPDGRLVHPIS